MNPTIQIKITKLQRGTLVFQPEVRSWCTMPYPGHPNGCPMYNTCPRCPPQAPYLDDIFNTDLSFWLITATFDLASHAARMKARHPNWSDRQARSCLYWQNTVRSALRMTAKEFSKSLSHELQVPVIFHPRPEALGVNLFRTMHRIGIPVKKNPHDTTNHALLVGFPSNKCLTAIEDLPLFNQDTMD